MTLLIHLSTKSVEFVSDGFKSMDNGRRNIKLDQTEFTDMDPWSRDSKFSMKACSLKKKKKGIRSLMKYLSN